MVEFISVAELLQVSLDIHERFQAPSRIAGRSRYLLQREARISSFLEAGVATKLPGSRLEGQNVAAEVAKHPALDPASRSGSPMSSFFDYLKLVARSDVYSELVTELHSQQNDGLFELLLGHQSEFRDMLEKIDFHLHIHPCQNISAARRLRTSPFIIIGSVDDSFKRDYHPLENCYRPRQAIDRSPSWEPTPVAATLFGRPQEIRKFAVLVGVANALTTAHKSRWYHRRLSASSIYVKKEIESLSKLEDMSSQREDLVKVADFLCPVTGCFDGCSQCDWKSQNAIADAGDFFAAIARRDVVLFSVHSDDLDGKNGERLDSVSFARLIVWIFAGSSAPVNFESVDDLSSDVISRVPWPLRWVIRDCKTLSLRVVLLYLRSFQELRIRPHCSHRSFIKIPGASSSTTSTTSEKADAILNQACIRAVMMGVETEEPEALIHLASYWETRASDVEKQRPTGGVSQDIRCAYECYREAALLGESDGLFHMARLQRECLTRGGDKRVESASPLELVRLLLKASACRNSKALKALRIISRRGVLSKDAFAGAWEGVARQECLVEQDFVDAIVDIAMCLRRGTCRLPKDHGEAAKLLEASKERLHPRGCLELGLLKVQIGESVESVREGVGLVSAASNTVPTPAAYDAHFWLGKWYHGGLVVRDTNGGTKEVLKRNSRLAVAHIRTGAEMGKHADCMALYAMFFRSGVYPLPKDEKKAAEWNLAAREKQSPIANYGFAAMKIKKAREAFKALDRASSGEEDVQSVSSAEDSGRMGRVLSKKRSSSSSTSDSPQQSDYRDALGRMNRRGITKCYEVALEALTETAGWVSASHPEEAENPLPLVMAAETIYRNIGIWADCAHEGDSQEQRSFRSEKLEEAGRLLEKASYTHLRPRWAKLRVNYLEEDLAQVRRAKILLQKGADAPVQNGIR